MEDLITGILGIAVGGFALWIVWMMFSNFFKQLFGTNNMKKKRKAIVEEKFGNAENINKIIENETLLFENVFFKITQNYIYSSSNHKNILQTEDVLWVYIYQMNVKNGAQLENSIYIYDKYNICHKLSCSSSKNDKVLKVLKSVCKNAMFGYTEENEKKYHQMVD